MEGKRKQLLSIVFLAGVLFLSPVIYGGGSLEPSGPPGPIFKTLDEVEPRVPIRASDLPLTITEPNSYYLAEDINFTDDVNHAVTIECNDVTIDLMGYSLTGPGKYLGTGSGIKIKGCSNVEIRNGTVREFGDYGISQNYSTGKEHRVIRVRAFSNRYYGIQLFGHAHLVKDCTVAENGTYGINTYAGCTVTGNMAYDNGSNGIYATSGCAVTGNICYDNGGDGIYAGYGCRVTGNICYDNGDDGITGCYSACTVTGNTAYSNASAGIHVNGSGNRIEANHVTDNNQGIDVDDSDNLIVKNSAAGNSTEYDIVGGNKVGTISTDPTTAGPWDNFDF